MGVKEYLEVAYRNMRVYERERAQDEQEKGQMTALDDRLTTIQKESGDLWQQLGQKEYVKRVLEAEMAQLCQRILQLNQEADALKKASASSG